MAIDTLRVARRLRDAGFSEPQAEAVVEAVREGAEDSDLATKRDLADLRSEMREMEHRLTKRMDEIKVELLSRIMTMILTAVLINVVTVLGALVVAIRLLAH